MAAAVHRAFTTRQHLAVQGPTGVGKSIAYLIPAVMAAQRGQRTVVVTSSKALQDQLAAVELPFLARALEVPFSFAVLKGRSNYLCEALASEVAVQIGHSRQQSLELGVEAAGSELDLGNPTVRAQVLEILDWSETTTTGDMAELAETPDRRVWASLSVGPGECVGATNCAHGEDCWAERARETAAAADIVVVNASLYGAHLQTGGALLPEHELLVIDEAHEFEDAMVNTLTVTLTVARVEDLLKSYRRCISGDETTVKDLRTAADSLERALFAVAPGRLAEGPSDELSEAVEALAVGVDSALSSLRAASKAAKEASREKHRIDSTIRMAEMLATECTVLRSEVGPGSVMWVEEPRPDSRALCFARINVASTLRQLAWDENEVTVVCCSATLEEGTARRLGLEAEFTAVPSPFNFADNALLYVPRIRQPKDPAWPDDVADEIEHLIRVANGRTLALFTSNRMLRLTVEACRERLPEFEILAQGDAPNPVLHARFLADEHTCLFATASFWTGVSSPGPTCSVVVVDKIPFPVPSDPIVEARSELAGDAAFMTVSVPAAGMQLAQGIGRLIRTAQDRGVVAVLDPRLAEARYRTPILNLLPPMRRVRSRDFVDRFIKGLELDG